MNGEKMTTAQAIDTLVNSYKSSAYMDKVTRQIAGIRETVSHTSHSANLLSRQWHFAHSFPASSQPNVTSLVTFFFKKKLLQGGAMVKKDWQPSFLTQSLVLTKRSFVNMYRDLGYYWLRFAIYIMLCLCVGTIFYDVGHSYGSIQVSEINPTLFMSGLYLMVRVRCLIICMNN